MLSATNLEQFGAEASGKFKPAVRKFSVEPSARDVVSRRKVAVLVLSWSFILAN